MRCFQRAHWLEITKEMESKKTNPHKIVRACVEDVRIMSLGVRWQCRAYSHEEANAGSIGKDQPPFLIEGDTLKK